MNAQNCPRPIFRRFFIEFGRFFVDFRSFFRRFFERFSCKFRVCPLLCFLLSAQSVSTSIHPRRPPLVPVVVLLLVLCGARCCIGCAGRFARSKSKTQKVNAQVLRPSIVGLLELARTTFTTNPQLSSNALTVRQSNLHLVHTYIHTYIHIEVTRRGAGVLGFLAPFPRLSARLFRSGCLVRACFKKNR